MPLPESKYYILKKQERSNKWNSNDWKVKQHLTKNL